MKNDRMFKLLYLLLERGTMTAPQLSRILEVSPRTVYRDVEALSMAGVPVYATSGKGGGISLMPGYTFNKALLSDQEQNQLLFSIQSLKAADQDVEALLSKLGGAFQKASRNWIEVDFSRWGLTQTDSTRFALLKNAILGKQVLQLTYCGVSGDATQRSVHPLKLIYKDKHWYLQAYCLRANDFRLFKVGRIVDVAPTGDVFFEEYEGEIPPIEIAAPSFSTVAIKLHISANLAFRIYDEFDPQCVTRQDDGSFIVDVGYPIDGWVVGYLFSFGTAVKVLQPPHLREQLAQYAQTIADHHKT